MLVLSRKVNQAVRIGADVEVTVVAVQGGKVRLAFAAPRDVPIVRTELLERDLKRDPSHTGSLDEGRENTMGQQLAAPLPFSRHGLGQV